MNVNCDKSPDGRHEVELVGDWSGSSYECKHCGKGWLYSDFEGMINAAMRLTAEEADDLIIEFDESTYDFKRSDADALRAYAAKWRGE